MNLAQLFTETSKYVDTVRKSDLQSLFCLIVYALKIKILKVLCIVDHAIDLNVLSNK